MSKPRADSLHTSPSSGIEDTISASFNAQQQGSSSTPSNSPWSAFSFSSGRRQSKQAKQAARQTELKRSASVITVNHYIIFSWNSFLSSITRFLCWVSYLFKCRLRMAQAIQRQLEEIEVKQKELEDQGVTLEKALRGEDSSRQFFQNILFDSICYPFDYRSDYYIFIFYVDSLLYVWCVYNLIRWYSEGWNDPCLSSKRWLIGLGM